jgi:ABC-type phosphate/phosphonate transport system substrate-binding protein
VSVLRFGVSRHHGGPKLDERARDFAFALGAAIGRAIAPILVEDYDHLLTGVERQEIDLAWLPPLVLREAIAKGAMIACVCQRHGALMYRSALLVHADSPFRTLRDLNGARAAWTDVESASGCVFPRRHLEQAGVKLVEKFFGSASAAAGAVADRNADVCAVFVTVDAILNPTIALSEARRGVGAAGANLRVIDVTAPIPPDGFVLSSQAAAKVAPIRDVLLGLHRRRDAAAALHALTTADVLVAANSDVIAAIQSL